MASSSKVGYRCYPKSVLVRRFSRCLETAHQKAEALRSGSLLQEVRAAGAPFQEMAHEGPNLMPGELRSEEAQDDLVREVLVRHCHSSQEIRAKVG
jgi:hypothetical protein